MTKLTKPFSTVLLLLSFLPLSAIAAEQDLHFNGLGFLTDRTKKVSVVAEAKTLLVKRVSDDEIVKEVSLSEPVLDIATKVLVRNADFTDITEPGIYYLDVPEVGTSKPFPISDDVFDILFRDSVLGMYGQRSGIDMYIEHGGEVFQHAAGHLEDGYLDYLGETGVFRDGIGGWYDAGDYGKYVGNGAFTAGMMLAAWEDFESTIGKVEMDIPESENDIPDYLDEVKYELDWLLKMQFEDGSVSHKLTELRFSGFVQPAAHKDPRYFTPFSTAATADFAAIIAKAARIYKPYDSDFAETCLIAAEKAYSFLTENTANINLDDHFPEGNPFRTGSYKTIDGDDRLWAAVELFETTGDPVYLERFESVANGHNGFISLDSFDWGDVKNLGTFVYLKSKRPERDPEIVAHLEALMLSTASTILENKDGNPFGRGLRSYFWGSNGTQIRTCMILHAANLIEPDDKYLDACVEQIDYLYGRNYYGRSQVTGIGYYPPCNPHDRRSGSDSVKRPYPGLLVGGGSDSTNWVDLQGSYETNEVAINWNGALVYALAWFLKGESTVSEVDFEPEYNDCTEKAPPPPPQYVPEDTDTGNEQDSDSENETDSEQDTEADTDTEDDRDAGNNDGIKITDGSCYCSTLGIKSSVFGIDMLNLLFI